MSSKHDDGGNGGLRRKSPQGVLDLLPDANHDNVKLVVAGDVGATPLEQQALAAKRQKVEANVVVHQQEHAESSSPGNAALEIGSNNLFPNTPVNQSKAEEDPTKDNDYDDNQNDDDDDAMMVEPLSTKSPAGSNPREVTKTTHSTRKEEEEAETTTETRPTHLREFCTEKPFVPLPETRYIGNDHQDLFIPPWATTCGTEQNVEFCDLCYCFVCNKPAKECQRWFSTEHPTTTTHNHCHATSMNMYKYDWRKSFWISLREIYTNEEKPELAAETETEAIDLATKLAANGYLKEPTFLPKEWGNKVEPSDQRVTPFVERGLLCKCRKCGWYTKSDSKKKTCYSCERIASDKCFSHWNENKKLYQPQPTDVLLGSKTIPFHIKAHDPRKLQTCQAQWAKYEGTSPEWIYDEAEMQEDVFRFRLGSRPWLGSILAGIQVMSEDKVPDDGSFKYWILPPPSDDEDDDDEHRRMLRANHDSDDEEDVFGDNFDFDFHREESFYKTSYFGYNDVILMDKNSRVIFEELYKLNADTNGEGPHHSLLAGDVVATWNKEARCGEFNVRLFLRRVGFGREDIGALLGAWFNIFPFSLSDLTGSIRARTVNALRSNLFSKLPFAADEDGEEALESILESATEAMEEAVENFNEDVATREGKLSLQSSLGNSCLLGGVCSSDTTFNGVLRRYLSEMLPDYINSEERNFKAEVSWFGQAAGVTAHHRVMRAREDDGEFKFRPSTFESYISDEEVPIACENLEPDCRMLASHTKSINALLVHLENLGHDEAPFVEGLNVELLPFQRQTLQWALDREQNPGGLQSFLWAKLPRVEDKNVADLYYNPLLKNITSKKPKLVRGGIIAEEMGLGKTVISLALILQNPAATTPESGSKSERLREDANTSANCVGWDPEWKCEEGQSPLKGSIISRGTLVVCHVSLVGQWIEEAKRRLQNPGLVYAYHGQNRKRDAMVLARNSIIVTTYATLAKDATYHASKAANNGVSDYCPPCEQIRWWRIICDESHALKQDTTQTKAVMSLVGDHKWAVSGTPWNTSLLDVKNQLKFIGLEYVDLMFSKFQDSVMKHVTNRRIRNNSDSDNGPKFGQFMFLMRAAMIRHAQNQQYRGTSTTLMSLPPKTEKTILIEFQGQEVTEYRRLEQEALVEYQAFRAEHWKKLSSHYLTLIQKLVPLRIACSGGRVPLVDISDENASANPIKKKKVQAFSEFSFCTKFDVLMHLLKQIRDSEPDSKSLVFSQYTSSLKFLQEELPKHGFQFRTLSGDMSLRQRAEALHAFQHDPPTTIFLLSMRAGAVGINLTQANRVFLLEPAMNPSLEAQAIGRVHRLGQTRKVEIVRLMMHDSIETKISQLVQRKYSSTLATTSKKDTTNASNGHHNVPDANAPIVGNMRTDKTAIMTGEFDFLFGMTRSFDDQHQDGVMWHGDNHDQDEEMTSGGDDSEDDDNSNNESDVPNGMASGMI